MVGSYKLLVFCIHLTCKQTTEQIGSDGDDVTRGDKLGVQARVTVYPEMHGQIDALKVPSTIPNGTAIYAQLNEFKKACNGGTF